jgi:hypothetical protein
MASKHPPCSIVNSLYVVPRRVIASAQHLRPARSPKERDTFSIGAQCARFRPSANLRQADKAFADSGS